MKQLKITYKITNRDSSSIKSYFNEISKVKLLDESEEIELTKKIKKGDKQALEKLILANLRFVVSVAKQYQNQGVPFDDLINEGNLGLIKAATRFDETKGFKFISYAVWWIRQSMMQSIIESSKIVRIPSNQFASINKMKKATSKFQHEHEREPTSKELADVLDEKESKIKNLMLVDSKSYISIDSYIDDDEERTYLDILPIQNEEDIEKKINNESFVQDLKKVIDKLKYKEKEILCMYYGIMNYSPMTLEEIGEYLDLTRERVRQIKDNAIKSLRIRDKSMILKQHLK